MPCPRRNHKPFARANAMKHKAVLHACTVSLVCLRGPMSHNPKPFSRGAAEGAEQGKKSKANAPLVPALCELCGPA